MYSIHVSAKNNTGNRAGSAYGEYDGVDCIGNTQKFDGEYDLFILEISSFSALEHMEDILDADDNIVAYRVYKEFMSSSDKAI